MDGRVMLAIPWRNHARVGTTDTAVPAAVLEPVAMQQEIELILNTQSLYLAKKPTRDDVLSVFAGVRPLVKSADASSTAALSRDHIIHIEQSGLLTICGGKWTTYRRMAEDCVNQAAMLAHLPDRACQTEHLKIHGFQANSEQAGHLCVYGTDTQKVQELMDADRGLAAQMHPDLPYVGAEVVWATRHEMARTVEDALARRTRALFLNAKAAMTMAPRVPELRARELTQSERLHT